MAVVRGIAVRVVMVLGVIPMAVRRARTAVMMNVWYM